MKISNNWLQQYLKIDLPTQKISELLTDIGLEVEGIINHENVKGGLKGIVIGEVLTKIKHPDADRLNITTVDVGEEKPLQIVCGAPNVNVGQKVPVATVGTWLFSEEDSFKIKKSKIRGQHSVGMICGQDEIGLGPATNGIMVLDPNAQVGLSAKEYFKIESDIIFEIGLTPNRSDAMSHIGVARDLKTVLNYNGANLSMCIPLVETFKVENNSLEISVEIKDAQLCPRYSGVSISNIHVKDSPKWLKDRLLSIGVNPINNVVDITNYVLHETGQPLHAFDAKKITGNKVIIQTLSEDTSFITLDNQARKLNSSDLMICNLEKPMCIAGVFGGLKSGVQNSTTDIFIESAYFNPISIRKTSKSHNLNTDASFRYERGCDPNITVYALKRAALMIKELCGGTISSDIVDVYPNEIKHHEIDFLYSVIDKLVGEEINRVVIKNILTDLEIKIIAESSSGLKLLVPPYRVDVTRDVDIVEEVLRIYGFNSVKLPEKLNTSINSSEKINSHKIKNIISNLLASNGFNEIMNNSLTKEKYNNLISDLDSSDNINIINPLSNDLNTLRRSMIFSSLETISYNQNRNNFNLKLFEFGKIYQKEDNLNIETENLNVLISGNTLEANWNNLNKSVDFFNLKETVEHILNRLGIKKFKTASLNNFGFDQGLEYKVKNKVLVRSGLLNPKLLNSFGIKNNVYSAIFNLDLLMSLLKNNSVKYKAVTKFPVVKRDLALVVDKNIEYSQLKKIALNIDNEILKSVNLFDVYEGDKIAINKKSYALSFILSDINKTLDDNTIDSIMNDLIDSFSKELGAEIRS